MKKSFKFGGAGILLLNQNYTYDTALTEFLENSTWSILDNSTLTSMVLVCNANNNYKVPFLSSRANNWLEPIKSIVIKLMICSNEKKKLLNLPFELRNRGKFSNQILISPESSVIKEASIQNDICFKSSIDTNTLLNGLCPCILGIKQLKYDDIFLDNIKDNNYIQEWSNIANNSSSQINFNESDFDKDSGSELPSKEDKSLFIPIKKISELENEMKQNINKNLIKFIDERYEDEFINFLYILNFAKFEFPDNELSLCILGMEFIDDFETFYSFVENAKNSAHLNAKKLVALKNEYDYNIYYNNLFQKELTHLPKCILWAMVTLHSYGYIHGDFHRKNVYVKIKDNTNITNERQHYLNDVIIIDFGKTFKLNKKYQDSLNNSIMETHLKELKLKEHFPPEKINLVNKYPYFSQFIISHIRIEFDKISIGFTNYFNLLVDLIKYYESIGIKNDSSAPSEMIDNMMITNFL